MVCNKMYNMIHKKHYKRKIFDISGNKENTTNEELDSKRICSYDSDSSCNSSQLSCSITPIQEKLKDIHLFISDTPKVYNPYHFCEKKKKCCFDNYKRQEKLLNITVYNQYKCKKQLIKYKYLSYSYKVYDWRNEYLFDDLPFPFILNPYACGVCPICIYKYSHRILHDDYECLFPNQDPKTYEKWFYKEQKELMLLGLLNEEDEKNREKCYKEKYDKYKRKKSNLINDF